MESKFRVIIVGGSIAGLTLAHCLDHLGVDYVVLEKRKEIAPQEGASIVVMPHAGRILDQLGLLSHLGEFVEPLHTAHVSYPDGFKLTDRSPNVLLERFGLPLTFLERRKLLQVLYNSLRDPSRVLVDSTVVSVLQNEGDIGAVQVQDGSIYRGDLIVGADGIHSRIRHEMWRLAGLNHPGRIPEKEKNGESASQVHTCDSNEGKLMYGIHLAMKIDYACVFGISDAVPDLRPGEQITGFQYGRSLLIFPGKNGRVFWFIFKKLDRQYSYSSAPRWSKCDADKIAEEFGLDYVWAGLRFKHVWNTRQVVGITNLEENVFSTWYSGRVVFVGDSMHKFAPNTGQGANCAIEDAAVLANYISKALATEEDVARPSYDTLQKLLHSFSQSRSQRAQEISKSARFAIRLSTCDSLFLRLLGRFVLPYMGDFRAEVASRIIGRGVQLSFLAPSRCSASGWQTFHPDRVSRSTYTAIIMVLGLLMCLAACRVYGFGL